ncbi:MAG TPA: hypothetical protein VGE62_03180 [Candidatus Paceibacterota bacterium]
MESILYAFELVGLALGAGGAFIFNSFFILCLKDHQLKKHEIVMLSRINLLSLTAAVIGLFAYVLSLASMMERLIIPDVGITGLKLCLYALALVTGLTLRKIHIPSLIRHQYEYSHLSPGFQFHQNTLASTASYSNLAWIFIIILTAVSIQGGRFMTLVSENILIIGLSFIIISLIASRLSIYLKDSLLSTR